MKYYVLYNPLAGVGAAESKINELSRKFDAEIVKCNITEITSYADFFANVNAEDAVILCGGDGTINRFVNSTNDVEISCDVMYFPAGTGNDFLTDIEKTVDDAPFSIKKYITNLPITTVNGKEYHFINNVGFGIDGYCAEMGNLQKVQSTKPVNYTAIAIKGLLFHYNPTDAIVTVDGKEYSFKKVWLCPTMKGRYYGGGMMAAPSQDRLNSEGELSVMLFHGAGRIKTLMAFPSIFKGEHINKKMVALFTGKDITVKFSSPATIQIDGEVITGVTEYNAKAAATAKVLEKV